MNINITSRKFRAKESLKETIRTEVRSLERFSDNILDVDVVLSYLHNKDSIKIAELSVAVPGKKLLVTEQSDDFSKSVSEGVDKLKRQLKRVKSKRLAKTSKR